ncbi:hypothetical protein BC830DRAFT_1172976 [Chytriomyces sp. MP71]|nr:hypothetical protein BC830DRAFT_1172976 [Chytriomyces sp. MP71]
MATQPPTYTTVSSDQHTDPSPDYFMNTAGSAPPLWSLHSVPVVTPLPGLASFRSLFLSQQQADAFVRARVQRHLGVDGASTLVSIGLLLGMNLNLLDPRPARECSVSLHSRSDHRFAAFTVDCLAVAESRQLISRTLPNSKDVRRIPSLSPGIAEIGLTHDLVSMVSVDNLFDYMVSEHLFDRRTRLEFDTMESVLDASATRAPDNLALGTGTVDFMIAGTSKVSKCTNCAAEGYKPCNKCSTSGKIRCSTCKGDGFSVEKGLHEAGPPEATTTMTTKTMKTTRKGAGFVEEVEVITTNYVDPVANKDSSNVLHKQTCARCSGSGKVSCNVCNGTTKTQCGTCTGHGSTISFLNLRVSRSLTTSTERFLKTMDPETNVYVTVSPSKNQDTVIASNVFKLSKTPSRVLWDATEADHLGDAPLRMAIPQVHVADTIPSHLTAEILSMDISDVLVAAVPERIAPGERVLFDEVEDNSMMTGGEDEFLRSRKAVRVLARRHRIRQSLLYVLQLRYPVPMRGHQRVLGFREFKAVFADGMLQHDVQVDARNHGDALVMVQVTDYPMETSFLVWNDYIEAVLAVLEAGDVHSAVIGADHLVEAGTALNDTKTGVK